MGITSKVRKFKEIKKMPKGFLSNSVMRVSYFYNNSSASKESKDVEALCREMRIVSHTIEKGMSLPNVHKGFGKAKIKSLLDMLDKYIEIDRFDYDYDAFLNTLGTVKRYVHDSEKFGCDISYIDLSKYERWLNLAKEEEFGVTELTTNDKLSHITDLNFVEFAHARHSMRKFADESLPTETVKKAIELANTAPSACNRQSVRIIHIKDKDLSQKILNIQGGAKGHSNSELLLVASDLSLYKHLSELNTPYLDGGIFLMNLLYACEYYNIATCPLIWDDYSTKGKDLRQLIDIDENIHVVAVVQIGQYPKNGVFAKSKRRKIEDIYMSY